MIEAKVGGSKVAHEMKVILKEGWRYSRSNLRFVPGNGVGIASRELRELMSTSEPTCLSIAANEVCGACMKAPSFAGRDRCFDCWAHDRPESATVSKLFVD